MGHSGPYKKNEKHIENLIKPRCLKISYGKFNPAGSFKFRAGNFRNRNLFRFQKQKIPGQEIPKFQAGNFGIPSEIGKKNHANKTTSILWWDFRPRTLPTQVFNFFQRFGKFGYFRDLGNPLFEKTFFFGNTHGKTRFLKKTRICGSMLLVIPQAMLFFRKK